MSEYEVTVSLDEEQHRVATRIARERGISIDELARTILLAVLMSNWQHGDAPQPTPDLNKPLSPPSGDPDTSIDTWYETWYSDVA